MIRDVSPSDHRPSVCAGSITIARRRSSFRLTGSESQSPPLLRPGAQPSANWRLRRFLRRLADELDVQQFFTSVIDATNAEFGTVQLLDRPVLRIVAHHGFAAEFLKYFETVSHDDCCCGAALKRGSRVWVSDVVCDPLFQDAKTQAIMLNSNVRACQSTSFFGQRGNLAGVIATHFQKPTTLKSLDWKQVNRIVADFTQKLIQSRQQPFSFST